MKAENIPVLDRGSLLERLSGDVDFLHELAGLFMEDCPKLMAEIRSAVADRNARGLEHAAHALKGSLSNFGGELAREAAWRLESMGRADDLNKANEAYANLEFEIQRFQQALGALSKESHGPTSGHAPTHHGRRFGSWVTGCG